MTILVTGGAGFIGSHLCEALLKQGKTVAVLDDFNDYYPVELKEKNAALLEKHGNCTIVRGDVRDAKLVDKLFQEHGIKQAAHLAARAGVRASLKDPQLYVDVNLNGTVTLLEAAKKHNAEQFVLASTSSVYGLSPDKPFRENDPVNTPIAPYPVSKRGAELMCHAYAHNFHIPTTVLRFFTVYGPRGRPDMVIYKFLDMISQGKTIPRYGDGHTMRSYTYIEDIVAGVTAALEKPFDYEIVNLGNDQTVELQQVISLIEENLGKQAVIEEEPIPMGDMEVTYANVDKARKLLGFEPKTNIKEGIEKTASWFKKDGVQVY